MAAQVVVMATAAATGAVDAMTAAAKAVVRVVRMAAVKAVASPAPPAMSNALKAVVRLKANAQNAMAATDVGVMTAMSVANAGATPANSVPSVWTSMQRRLALSCLSQPMHALSALPAMSVVANAVNVVKAAAANATKTARHAKIVASATPKVVQMKAWRHAKTATMLNHRLTDATNSVAAMDAAAMDAVTSAVLAKRKVATTLSNLKPTWHFQNLQHRKAMRRSLSKAGTQMRCQHHKAKAASHVSLAPATAMVVTVAIALTVQSTPRRTPWPRSHKWLRLQLQRQLLSVWLLSHLHRWPQRQWQSQHRLQWLPPHRRLLRARRVCPRWLATHCRPTTYKRLRNPLVCNG